LIVVIVVVVIVDHAAVDSNIIDVLYYSCSVGAKLFLSVLIQLRMIEVQMVVVCRLISLHVLYV
jgi:hypothetical protein